MTPISLPLALLTFVVALLVRYLFHYRERQVSQITSYPLTRLKSFRRTKSLVTAMAAFQRQDYKIKGLLELIAWNRYSEQMRNHD